MTKLEIRRVPVLRDNYVWLAHEASSNVTAAVGSHGRRSGLTATISVINRQWRKTVDVRWKINGSAKV